MGKEKTLVIGFDNRSVTFTELRKLFAKRLAQGKCVKAGKND